MERLRTIGHKIRPSGKAPITLKEKRADPFYLSVEWKDLMRQIIKVRGRRCEDKEHNPSLPREGIRIFGDHIKELRDGGEPLNQTNVMLRCATCHGRKTAQARAQRSRNSFASNQPRGRGY